FLKTLGGGSKCFAPSRPAPGYAGFPRFADSAGRQKNSTSLALGTHTAFALKAPGQTVKTRRLPKSVAKHFNPPPSCGLVNWTVDGRRIRSRWGVLSRYVCALAH